MNLDNPLLSLSGFGLLGLSSSCKQKRHLPITKNGFFTPLIVYCWDPCHVLSVKLIVQFFANL